MARTRPTPQRGARRRQRLDPTREIVVHQVTDGPAKGWIHTHGLDAHGKPELEIRNVPLFLGGAATRLLNDIADHLLNDAVSPFLPGDLVTGGRTSIQVLEARPDEGGGYDEAHYRTPRLVLVDAPGDACACDECAKELARRSRLAN
jgi:hypothetical protein